MELLTGIDAGELKSSDKRAAASPRFKVIAPTATRLVVELLDLIQFDIKLRNMDTHNVFFHIWLYDGSNAWEPTDVLLDAKRYQMGADVEVRLRTFLRRFVETHCERIDGIMEKAQTFADEVMGIKTEPPEIIIHE